MSQVEGSTGPGPVGDPANQSIAELIKEVSEESSRLLRGELKLAQAEMTEKAKTAGVGIGAFGAAAVLGWFALGLLLGHRYLGVGPGAAGLAGRTDRCRRGCYRGGHRGVVGQEEGRQGRSAGAHRDGGKCQEGRRGDQGECPPMSSTTPAAPPDPPADATPEEIEAHIQESRERLASTVDALTNKLDVKAQAKQKAHETSEQAKQKVQETSEQAKQKAPRDLRTRADRRSACLRAGLRASAHHLASGVGRGSRRCCRARGGARRAAAALLQQKLSTDGPHLGLPDSAVIVMY